METGGKIKFALFGIVILIFIGGGYYLMRQSEIKLNENRTTNTEKEENKEIKDIRKDGTKEYIYYTNYERIVDELDIEFKDAVFNFGDYSSLAKELNDETKELKKTLVYDEDSDDIAYNKLKSAKYKQYEYMVYDDYISFIVRYYNFNKDDLVTFEKAKSYVFSKKENKLFTEEDLLAKYNITLDDAKNKIKTYIQDQDLLKEGEKLDASATVEGLNSLNLFVDKLGKLNVTILVKSDQKDYNDNIKLS